MTFEMWCTFVIASALLIAMPGPTNLLVMGYALRVGIKPAMGTVFGVVPGLIVAMTLSFIGFGAVLATSAELFLLMKWAGALYLIALGIVKWRAKPPGTEVEASLPRVSTRTMVLQAFLVTVLNPHSILFFMAFMPQFIVADAPAIPQMLILETTFVTLVLPISMAYVLCAGRLRERIRNVRTQRIMNRTGGVLLIGAGVMTATMKRS